MKLLVYLRAKHRFFFAESPSYMAGCETTRYDWCRAYVRFMAFSLTDWFRGYR